jgi:hypothetical protein
MSIPKTVYLISNGSTLSFPKNTLTQFVNKLPSIFELEKDENIQVSLESIGFSGNFRNVALPENSALPSFVITNCDVQKDRSCLSEKVKTAAKLEGCLDTVDFDYSKSEGSNPSCVKKEYFLKDMWYNESNLKTFFDQCNEDNLLNFKFENNKIHIDRNPDKDYWLFIHPTFTYSFWIHYDSLTHSEEFKVFKEKFLAKNDGTEKSIKEREEMFSLLTQFHFGYVHYKGEYYYACYLTKMTPKILGYEIDLLEKRTPSIIKVHSSIISSQILNNSHSKDLVCFCPDFSQNKEYYFKEFEQPQTIKLENTDLTQIDISLRDRDNRKLELLEGVATIVSLKFQKMNKNNKTFNVRLTSSANKFFPDNDQSKFRVKMPNTLEFSKDRNWKVALTSISYPNKFISLPGSENDRAVQYVPWDIKTNPEAKRQLAFFDRDTTNIESLLTQMNEFLEFFEQKLTKTEDNILTFSKPGLYFFSVNVLKVLGADIDFDSLTDKKVYKFAIADLTKAYTLSNKTCNVVSTDTEKKFDCPKEHVIKFKGSMNMDLFRPDYFITYCNIVEATIIGGEYNNILRVIPISKNENDNYIIHEFKNKNYIPLLNTEISEIEINIRSHDGGLIEFASNEMVIVNLEFANTD